MASGSCRDGASHIPPRSALACSTCLTSWSNECGRRSARTNAANGQRRYIGRERSLKLQTIRAAVSAGGDLTWRTRIRAARFLRVCSGKMSFDHVESELRLA